MVNKSRGDKVGVRVGVWVGVGLGLGVSVVVGVKVAVGKSVAVRVGLGRMILSGVGLAISGGLQDTIETARVISQITSLGRLFTVDGEEGVMITYLPMRESKGIVAISNKTLG